MNDATYLISAAHQHLLQTTRDEVVELRALAYALDIIHDLDSDSPAHREAISGIVPLIRTRVCSILCRLDQISFSPVDGGAK